MKKHNTETIYENYKGSPNLVYIDNIDTGAAICYKGREYGYLDICEALDIDYKMLKRYSANQLIEILENSYIPSKRSHLNEVKYDFNHIDPRTGLPKVIERERPENSIELMNRMPSMTGWIVMLQNRVNLNSVGNNSMAAKVWYDRTDHTVSSSEDKEDAVDFRSYRLRNGQKPGGWMNLREYRKFSRKF